MAPQSKGLFRETPPQELVQEILESLGFSGGLRDSRYFLKDDLKDANIEEWIPLLEPYYLPCKAKRYLDKVDKGRIITIIRHIIRPKGFDLRVQEKTIGGIKKTIYRIEPVTPSFKSRDSGVLIHFS